MKLTVLGSGITISPPEIPFRFSSAHLIEVDDKKILFDASLAVLPQLGKLNISISDISTIFISHYHADHFLLEPILQALYVRSRVEGIRGKLNIYGPSDIEHMTRTGYETKGWDYDNDFLNYVDIAYFPYTDAQPMQITNTISVIPYKTQHFSFEAYCLKMVSSDCVVSYSGDSAMSSALENAAGDSDIFICESFIKVGGEGDTGHISLPDIAAVAKNNNVKKLILVHYTGIDSPEAMIKAIKSAGFDGEVEVARDLSSYELGNS